MAAAASPPFCLTWDYFLGRRSIDRRMHLAVLRAYWRTHPGSGDRVRLLLRFLSWPVVSVREAVRYTRRNASFVREREGKSAARQFGEQLAIALRHGVPPRAYYLFRLYEPAKRGLAPTYMHRFETKKPGAFRLLHRFRDTSILDDKEAFWARCRDNGLPVVPLVARLSAGRVEAFEGKDGLPDVDLFVKPREGKGGRGAVRYDCVSPRRFRRPGSDEVLSHDELLARLARQSEDEDLLVQRRLVNHSDIAHLSNGALTTMRILTCLDEHGLPEALCAVFRMAVGRNVTVDNIHAGGIAAGVDLSTGRLGRATALDPKSDWFDAHPDTGGRIAGTRLPMARQAVELARRAHACFSECVVAGWDVGLTPEGPVLVEGNSAPCVTLLQRPLDRGLADGRFGELLHYHLCRLPPRKRRRRGHASDTQREDLALREDGGR